MRTDVLKSTTYQNWVLQMLKIFEPKIKIKQIKKKTTIIIFFGKILQNENTEKINGSIICQKFAKILYFYTRVHFLRKFLTVFINETTDIFSNFII